jgi:hypothetical protein
MVPLPDPSAATLATFKALELQVSTFCASRLVMHACGFLEENLPICFRCLRWNLIAPCMQCHCDGWTGCGHCLYIQHARCKDISLAGLS